MAEIAGLKLIVPSSVAGSGVSVSASGKVSFTAATSVSVNGCFDSTYDNYLVVLSTAASGSASLDSRLRLSGSDASGTDYTRQSLFATGTSISSGRDTSQTYARLHTVRTSNGGAHFYFYGPSLAQPTAVRSVTVDPGSSGVLIGDNACTHSLSTAYDGFTIFPTSGNLTGSLTVYGLSQ